jgi:hypothetical protein
MNESEPGANAAAAFPQAAAANRNVFYRPDGAAKSVREVYDWALAQPGGQTNAPAAISPIQAKVVVASAGDNEIEALLASVAGWQPTGFFSTPGDGPLRLSPDLLGMFSSDPTKA